MVLTVDIKDIRARVINGQCVANCDYDTKLHGDTARLKIKESWMTCFQICIRIAEEKMLCNILLLKPRIHMMNYQLMLLNLLCANSCLCL